MNDDLITGERSQDQRRVSKRKTKSYINSALQKKYESLTDSATNYFLLKDFKKAKVAVTQAMRIRPTAALFALSASISEALGRFQEAGDFRLLQAFEAKDKVLWQELLHDFIENGMWFRATVCLKRLALLAPVNSQERRDLYLQLADLLVNLGEISGAIRVLVSLWGGGKSWDFDVFSTLSSLLFQLGKWHSLEKLIEESLTLFLPAGEADDKSGRDSGRKRTLKKSKENVKSEDEGKVADDNPERGHNPSLSPKRDDGTGREEEENYNTSDTKEKSSKSVFEFMFKSSQVTGSNAPKSGPSRHSASPDDDFSFFDGPNDDMDKGVESPFFSKGNADKDDNNIPSAAPWRPLKDEKEERDFMRIINLYAELLVERGKFSDCITMLLNVASHFGIMLSELHPDLLLKYAVAQAYMGDVSQGQEVIEHLLTTPGKCSPAEYGDVLFDAADVMAKVGCFTTAEKVYRYLLRYHRGIEQSRGLANERHDSGIDEQKEYYFDDADSTSAMAIKNKEIRKKSREIAYNYVSGPATEGLSLAEKRDRIARDVALLYGIAKCCAKESRHCGPFGQIMRKEADINSPSDSVSNLPQTSHRDNSPNHYTLQHLLEIHEELDPYHVPTRVLLSQIYKEEYGDIEAAEQVLLPKSFGRSSSGVGRGNGGGTRERIVSASEALLNYHKQQKMINVQRAFLGDNLDLQSDGIKEQKPLLEGITALQDHETDPVVVELSRESGFQRTECDVHLILLYASVIKSGGGSPPFPGCSSSQSSLFSCSSPVGSHTYVHSVAIRLLTLGIPILQGMLAETRKGIIGDDDDVISVAPGSSSSAHGGGRRTSFSAFGCGVISMPSLARTSSSIIPANRVALSLAGDGGGASLLSYAMGSIASATHSIATSSRASQSKGHSLLSKRGVSAGGSSIAASTTALSIAASDMGASSSHYTQMLDEKDGSSIFHFKKKRRGEGGSNKNSSSSSTISRSKLLQEHERRRHQQPGDDNCSVGNMDDIEAMEALLGEGDDEVADGQDSLPDEDNIPDGSTKRRVRFSDELEVVSQPNASQNDDVNTSQTKKGGKRERPSDSKIKEKGDGEDSNAQGEDPYALPSIDDIIAHNFGTGSIMGSLFKRSMMGSQEEEVEKDVHSSGESALLLNIKNVEDASHNNEALKDKRGGVSHESTVAVQHGISPSGAVPDNVPVSGLETGARVGARESMASAAAQDINRIHDKSPSIGDYIRIFGGRTIIVRLAMSLVDAYTELGEYVEAKDFATYFLLKVNNCIFKRHGSLMVPLQISILRLSLLTNQIGEAVRATVSLLQQEGRVRMKRSCSESFNSSSSISSQSSIFNSPSSTSDSDDGENMVRDVWEIVAALVNRGMKSGILRRLYKEREKRDTEILVIQANSYFLRGSYRLALPLYLVAHAASRRKREEANDQNNGQLPHLSSKRLLWPSTRGDILLLFMVALCYLLGAFVRTNPFRHEHVQAAFFYLQEYFEACCELAASRRYYSRAMGGREGMQHADVTQKGHSHQDHSSNRDIFPRELDKGVFGLCSSAALPFSTSPQGSSYRDSYYEGQQIDEAMMQETLRPSIVVIEALYNIARCYHHLSLCYLAIPLYERVLKLCSAYPQPLSPAGSYQRPGFSKGTHVNLYPPSMPDVTMDDIMSHTLAQAARYNLSCIYRYKGGNASLAFDTLLRKR